MIPSAIKVSSRPAYRRRIRYVDRSIQRSLLIAMVSLEMIMVAASIWLAHWRLTNLIDESLYRVHLVQTGPTLVQLALEGFGVVGLFAVLNLVALLLTERIWEYHNSHVLQDLAKLIGKTKGLDFSVDPETRQQHEALALAMNWRARERTRFAAIRELVTDLTAAASAGESPQDIRNSIESLKKLLP